MSLRSALEEIVRLHPIEVTKVKLGVSVYWCHACHKAGIGTEAHEDNCFGRIARAALEAEKGQPERTEEQWKAEK